MIAQSFDQFAGGRQLPPGFFVPSEAGTDRLVKGSKSPTRENEREGVHKPGTIARLLHRTWSGEWRIRLECELPHGLPPEQEGERITGALSWRGANAIGDSCEYVGREFGGYTTFLTLTLDDAARRRIETRAAVKGEPGKAGDYCNGEQAAGDFCRVSWGWESSIQREASRFFDAVSKMYRRGWVPAYRRERQEESDGAPYTPITFNTEGQKLGGPDYGPVDRLLYCWVAENPINEHGERNPHIHVLIRWSVPFAFFPCWAKRIESLWGQGFAHLEKLKERKAGAYYMAKAAGYLSKAAGQSDQGPIRGNRYGMAAAARAPGWVPVLAWAWGILGHLMKEARERRAALVSPLRQVRDKAAGDLKQAKRGTGTRQKIARLLQRTRDAIKAVPVVTRWAATFATDEPLDRFLKWAERQGWRSDKRPDHLYLGNWKQNRENRERRREFWRRFMWEEALDAMRNWYDRWEPVFSGYRDEGQQWERVYG